MTIEFLHPTGSTPGFGFELPPGACLLAGDTDAVQAFSFADHARGLQFHLEADETIIRSWIAHYGETASRARYRRRRPRR